MAGKQSAVLLLLTLALAGGSPQARAAGNGCATSTFTSTVARAIPDPGAVTSSVVVPAGALVSRVEVTLGVSHPFDSDLRVELDSPRGKRVLLAEAVGTWGDHFDATTFADDAETSIVSSLPPFAGRYRPAESLAAFAGSSRAGTWKLKVSDLRARYQGRIESWRLDLVSCAKTTQPKARAGAPTPPPLQQGAPSGAEPVEGRLVTVTTTHEAADGDVSSVQALETSPGFDGISLREAIMATNNDPGTYTIRFADSLAGVTIPVTNELPLLRGGSVFIDGDIDGDGRPDLTLLDARHQVEWAFNVASSGNRVHALVLRGFTQAVLFTAMKTDRSQAPLLKGRTFARNVVSGLVLDDVGVAIAVDPTFGHQECERTPCRTRSHWLDTRLVGNTIDSRPGTTLRVGWIDDSGDAMERVTVAGNRLHVGRRTGKQDTTAIDVGVGYRGTSDNRISDALVAYNAIELRDGKAIQVLAGQRGRSGNLVEDVRIVGNAVRFSPHKDTEGVAILVSDGCWNPSGGCVNAVRRIEVVGNALQGPYAGVQAGEPCCGGSPRNTITDVRIVANLIEGVVLPPAQFLNPWGVVIGGGSVSKISVDSNTIVQRVAAPEAGSVGNIIAGGIAVLGGLEKDHASVRGVSIANNRVDTKLMGIVVLGGGPKASAGPDYAGSNRVSRIELRGNVITRVPVLATRWYPMIKGISLIGGLGDAAHPGWRATGNTVACVTVKKNVVAGKRDDVAVLANLGPGASGNIARLGGC